MQCEIDSNVVQASLNYCITLKKKRGRASANFLLVLYNQNKSIKTNLHKMFRVDA